MFSQPSIIELEDLLLAIKREQSLDFTDYCELAMYRQFKRLLKNKQTDASSIINRVGDFAFYDELVNSLIIDQTEFFRDPTFWIILKKNLLPQLLQAKSVIDIWVPSTSSGEELYSLLIVLDELNAIDKVRIVGSEIHDAKFAVVKNGLFGFKKVAIGKKNYERYSGSVGDIPYLTDTGGCFKMDNSLLRNVEFKKNRLGLDSAPGEFDFILCRNVLLSQTLKLTNKSYRILTDSLKPGGYIALGNKEKFQSAYYESKFSFFNEEERVYQKK